LLALLLGRLVERALRVHGATPGKPWIGWDKKATQKPTAFLMMTTVAALRGSKGGGHRHLAPPWSSVPQASLNALGVPETYCTLPRSR
jgi:hypothetical protein